MAFLTELWIPIVLSAVIVFVVSSILHMAIPMHKSDYKKLASEDAVLEAMRANGVRAGTYMFPCAGSKKEMNTPEMKAKIEKGPVGWMTILPPGGHNMGKSLFMWFVHSLIIGVLVAYVGWHALAPGAHYLRVFQITGCAAVLAYAAGHMQDSIWKGQRWSVTGKFIIDGVIYGLMTAGTFGAFWPAVTPPA